ncbi:MAG: DUF2079 domain-containing protein [Microcystis aeruginosa L111-01]|uniref:DUF2079 domain-containing protein n=1 Tax=Microcystis aeruginosa G11-04 TaxID=2685956 RepID=A0A966G1S8_MICAE|nr:DUF2079 domain-containing protein [Microcystis aeruginosa W13-16]NCQ73819.1 DUF2079 domain-containing protein [Microcystis aeruginosa W13-13]NCQ78117.1 DUF2079 domain-containing protein [Microcystis aeruginosa W13-15]NCQ86436.1 DUF2079 domain-containing protein [Microcystis aeruginosa W13-18]NCR13600.1 DUF2079 domain-containing protein [Microcystis aeruginosa SX13-11]NCR16809.1 DUF2079 domain-containing protein [Microcystis aeruginosa LL13-03]NCR22014.1 DUF2079 domain-containing protein [M
MVVVFDSLEIVLTTSQIAPHLTHRLNLQLTKVDSAEIDLQQFDYVLLNQRHPGWTSRRRLSAI